VQHGDIISYRFDIFIGVGSSYDYGIPTMDEMAEMLHQQVIELGPSLS
jgi:hypothetical protein